MIFGLLYTLLLILLLSQVTSIALQSNYNYSQVHQQALFSDHTPFPFKPRTGRSNRASLLQKLVIKKYQFRDTGYNIQNKGISQSDQQMLFQMDPSVGIFTDQSITVQNYKVLQLRKFHLNMRNPSKRLTLCVNQVISDAEQINEADSKNKFPVCLKPQQKRVFNFTLYAWSLNPQFIKATIYLMVEIYDGLTLAQQKIYSRRVFASVVPNHFRIQNPKTTPQKSTVLTIKNYQSFDIYVQLSSQKQLSFPDQSGIAGQKRLSSSKTLQISIDSTTDKFIVHTSDPTGSRRFTDLLVKPQIVRALSIQYINIGIMIQDKMVLSVPVIVHSHSIQRIILLSIEVQSDTQTVQVQSSFSGGIDPMQSYVQVARLSVYSSKLTSVISHILIKIKYKIDSQQKVHTTSQTLVYAQVRNGVAAGHRKYIDLKQKDKDNRWDNRFPIKNNLNIPIYLTRVTVDDQVFKLGRLPDLFKAVYPNFSIQEMQLSYIGPSTIPISPKKYLIMLQFNGNIVVPMQLVVYDHTLQCLYDNVVYKCAELPIMQFGYFRDTRKKSRQLIIRNWNPQTTVVEVHLSQNTIKNYGINATVTLITPTQQLIKYSPLSLRYFLKPQKFGLVRIDLQLLQNATSATFAIQILSNHQNLIRMIRVRVQNGTIALIPQITRINDGLSRSLHYLNLVSTYSQKYYVQSVQNNLSSILFLHHDTSAEDEVLQNQWVGVTLVHDPFNQRPLPWKTQDLQVYYFRHYRSQVHRTKTLVGQFKLRTSTQLQVLAHVIIDNAYQPLLFDAIANSQSETGPWSISKKVTKRPKNKQKKQVSQSNQLVLSIKNPFDMPVQYKLHLLSPAKHKHLLQVQSAFYTQKSTQNVQAYLCISQQLKNLYSITSNTIKTLFNVVVMPQQCSIQSIPSSNNNHDYVTLKCGPNKRYIIDSVPYVSYLSKSFKQKLKICYSFNQRNYVSQLIHTNIPNRILNQFTLNILTQFIKIQMAYLDKFVLFELDHVQLHSHLKQDFRRVCQQTPLANIYRFCHYLKSKIRKVFNSDKTAVLPAPDQTYMLQIGQVHNIVVQVPSDMDPFSFYLVIANNCTQFQTFLVQVNSVEPRLQLQFIYPHPHSKFRKSDYQTHFVKQWDSSRWSNRGSRVHRVPVCLSLSDFKNQLMEISGSRTYQFINNGQIPIRLSWIGIQQIQRTCSYKGIVLQGLGCPPQPFQYSSPKKRPQFILQPSGSYNLTINYNFPLRSALFKPVPQPLHMNVYLYDQKGYHFKLTVYFQITDNNLKTVISALSNKDKRKPLLNYLVLNIVSICFILLLVLQLKKPQNGGKNIPIQPKSQDIDSYKAHRHKRFNKIVRESAYSDMDSAIGTRILKMKQLKPIQRITQDLLLSVRQARQRQLKRYFTESQQSQINNMLGINHHLSMSQSISYQHQQLLQDKDNNQEQQQPNQSSNQSLSSGVQVQLGSDVDQDSWYDFNKEISAIGNRSASRTNLFAKNNSITQPQQVEEKEEQDQFYNVFRTETGLRRQGKPKWQ